MYDDDNRYAVQCRCNEGVNPAAFAGYPNFPLEITLKLSEQFGLTFGNLSISEARAVDAMIRHAMLVGWDACNTAAKHGPDNVIEKRDELKKGLFQ